MCSPLIDGTFFAHESADRCSFLKGILTAEILIGAFVGSFTSMPLTNKYGRKFGLFLCGTIAFVGALLLSLIDSFTAIILSRTLLGLAVGFTGTLGPLYVNEMSPESIRGQLGTVFQISICGTILAAQVVNYLFNSADSIYMPAWKWHLQFGLGAIPGALLAIASRIVPESPAFLEQKRVQDESIAMRSNRQGEAHHSLAHYSSQTDAQPQSMSMLFKGANLKWVLIGLILAMGNQLTGINAIIFYSPAIFKEAGFHNTLVMQFSVVGVWNLLTVFISFALVDRLGRRPLMLVSLACMALATFILGTAYAFFPAQKATIAIFSIMLYIGAFECGPGPLFFLLAVETFPPHVQKSALGLANGFAWSFNILVSFTFPVVNQMIGPASTFYLFSAITVACLFMVHLYLPETSTKTNSAAMAHAAKHGLNEEDKGTNYRQFDDGDEQLVAGVLRNKV